MQSMRVDLLRTIILYISQPGRLCGCQGKTEAAAETKFESRAV